MGELKKKKIKKINIKQIYYYIQKHCDINEKYFFLPNNVAFCTIPLVEPESSLSKNKQSIYLDYATSR